MKRVIAPAVITIMLLLTACAHNFEISKDLNYTPPSIKSQPRLIYPIDAQERAYSGTIQVYLQITSDGFVNKVHLIKSTGYDLLDKTTINYCQHLVFTPALKNGVAVDSRIEWEIKYNLSNQNETSDSYVRDLESLYKQYSLSLQDEKNSIEKSILQKHMQFIANLSDGRSFNKAIKNVITSEISSEWEHVWNSWPLTFLVYHDFIERFKDYYDIASVKSLLRSSLLLDIQYIKETQISDDPSKIKSDFLLNKIKKFVTEYYPDLNIDILGVGLTGGVEPVAQL